MIFGLEERETENLTARIGEMFGEIGEIGEKPRAEAVRVGKKSSGKTRHVMEFEEDGFICMRVSLSALIGL